MLSGWWSQGGWGFLNEIQEGRGALTTNPRLKLCPVMVEIGISLIFFGRICLLGPPVVMSGSPSPLAAETSSDRILRSKVLDLCSRPPKYQGLHLRCLLTIDNRR